MGASTSPKQQSGGSAFRAFRDKRDWTLVAAKHPVDCQQCTNKDCPSPGGRVVSLNVDAGSWLWLVCGVVVLSWMPLANGAFGFLLQLSINQACLNSNECKRIILENIVRHPASQPLTLPLPPSLVLDSLAFPQPLPGRVARAPRSHLRHYSSSCRSH